MCRVASAHTVREAVQRAVARLLIVALALPVPAVGATPRAPLGVTAEPVPPAPCDDAIRSGSYPAVTTAQSELWPPNHALVDAGLRVDTGPTCLGRAVTRVAVYSSEPDDALGDGSLP